MAKEKSEKTKREFPWDTSYSQNRELSWLKFNQRVLEEASDPNVPLYERLKFLSIFTSNLDEFFMVRVGSLHDLSLLKHLHIDNKTGMTPSEQLSAIFSAVAPLYAMKDKVFRELEASLRQHDVEQLAWSELQHKEKEFISDYYETYIQPVLSPQIIDLHHPFPHLANNALYVCVSLKSEDKELYGILPVPPMLPRILTLPGTGASLRYLMMESILLKFANREFSMYNVTGKGVIRVTRNADIHPDDEQYDVDDNFRMHMSKMLKKRGRLSPVRLEVQPSTPPSIVKFLASRTRLNLKKEQIFSSNAPLDMSYVFELGEKFPRSTLRALSYETFSPQPSASIAPNESVLRQVLRKDILLFYPYEKMDGFLRLIREASQDPNVISIKITIYRLASKSKLVEYLTAAVENKKEVTVLMELRARFDEENNINWSAELEEAGCKVIYGFEGYKVHSKICLITRREKNRIQHITQIGTGNYNEKTARMYTDLCLMTSDPEIGADAANFFQNMAISNLDGNYQHLLVAPHGLKAGILNAIDRQIRLGENGRIMMKMNSLTDREIIDRLCKASQAGVCVYLNIRGICCIRPGVPGKTDRITVCSIVGRYLEHPRIYCFGSNPDHMEIYIGSADMMTRNTERRVEILAPVRHKRIQKQIVRMMNIIEHDTIKARRLRQDGTYERLPLEGAVAIDSQAYFMNLAGFHAQRMESQSKSNLFSRIAHTIFKRNAPNIFYK